ncbi:MAG: hypothetical protein KJ989_14165 [Gammaproteobacteria bacterium]|nr:hypothetical protein [Gammaproteobacteria bacterium]MBU2158124.1 hypothetical protein [Gammaproteobacteria bacterium]MBU2255734.1 hypothetical protein [Gammaproteobacteria bacterium]MBU2295344.1 hypothetical protein [Gammaproteobacteria bacterium]
MNKKSQNSKFWRVFVGPVEIAGIADGIAQGLCDLGVDAQVLLSTAHRFEYGNTTRIGLICLWQRIGQLRAKTSRDSFFLKIALVLLHRLLGVVVLLYAAIRFDAFIFIYGQTITNSRFELWLLRQMGRKIVFFGVGSDTRPPYVDGGLFPGIAEDDLPDPAILGRLARERKQRLRIQEFYADFWINAPASAQFHERRYINWSAIGVPKKIVVPSSLEDRTSSVVRILHSPSNALAKGTPLILEAIERLRIKGYEIELILIQDMPNARVLEELARCDFIIDQLYSDAPMAGFSAEAAFFGKPAVIGGYFSNWIGSLDSASVPPSLFVAPEEIQEAIERLISDAKLRLELGERAKLFVTERWNVRGVAARFLRLLNDDVPEDWWCEPGTVCYLEGSGLPLARAKRLVASLIEYGGVSALQLGDKPDFERAFCHFADYPPPRGDETVSLYETKR